MQVNHVQVGTGSLPASQRPHRRHPAALDPRHARTMRPIERMPTFTADGYGSVTGALWQGAMSRVMSRRLHPGAAIESSASTPLRDRYSALLSSGSQHD